MTRAVDNSSISVGDTVYLRKIVRSWVQEPRILKIEAKVLKITKTRIYVGYNNGDSLIKINFEYRKTMRLQCTDSLGLSTYYLYSSLEELDESINNIQHRKELISKVSELTSDRNLNNLSNNKLKRIIDILNEKD